MASESGRARDGAITVESLLLGPSSAMQTVRDLVRRVAPSTASVLITGPSGSGKERVARAVHSASERSSGPFVAINCGAIPRDLLESELFGHEKGSFTGANAMRQGRFEEAHKGTMFLDEIGDMPSDMQVKLLRVLEERSIARVGGRGTIGVDVRIVSATHRELGNAIDEQRFREDLYYRLAVFPIHIPGLAARVEDIAVLIEHFAKGMSENAPTALRLSHEAQANLRSYSWPGNVRELRNFVERAVILHRGEQIGPEEASAMLLHPRRQRDGALATVGKTPEPFISASGIDLRAIMHDIEGRYISEALSCTNNVVSDAARLLGLQRTTLVDKMRRHAA
jgi:sigma-54 dependent transcriptional regulator, flagellar regulatory protein